MSYGAGVDDATRRTLLSIGGSRQQAEAVSSVLGYESLVTEHLANRLLLLFGWGVVSANVVQWIAEGAVLDGSAQPSTIRLSKLGGAGKYSGNCRRDLFCSFCPSMTVPRPILVTVPKEPSRHVVEWKGHMVMPLLQVIQTIHDKHPFVFSQMFATETKSFWDSVPSDDPNLTCLGDLQEDPSWKSKTIPYMLHGDGAAFEKEMVIQCCLCK